MWNLDFLVTSLCPGPTPHADGFLCLDCRRVLPYNASGATGYARLAGASDPDDTGHYLCYPCADRRQRADFAHATSFFAYLSGDGARVTTWPGGTLARVTYRYTSRRVVFGRRVVTETRFRATAPDGSRWYGTSPGPGMYARLRRAKSRGRVAA